MFTKTSAVLVVSAPLKEPITAVEPSPESATEYPYLSRFTGTARSNTLASAQAPLTYSNR